MSPREKRERGRTGQPTDLEAGSNRTSLDAYPELHPIRLLAVDAAIYTFAIDVEIESDLVVHLDESVIVALIAAYAPIAAIVRQTTRVADSIRAAQLAAAARNAEAMATQVAEVVATLLARRDASAVRVAQAAADAADRVAAAVAPGGEQAAAFAAAQVATAVHDAAAAMSEEYSQAAAVVARACADAAARMTDTADVQNAVSELKVREADAAVRAIALDACYQVAINAANTAAEQALTKQATRR